MRHYFNTICGLFLFGLVQVAGAESKLLPPITQPIPVAQLTSFATDDPAVKALITNALLISKMNLTYLYGSSDPKNKGMDCSGTIYYLLTLSKVKNIPRQSDQMFDWVLKKGLLYRVGSHDINSPEFSHLKPGDLLFWSGTYTTNRHSAISHVMIYLGENKSKQHLMFGSSDGRTYQGKKMRGVSVFTFTLPDVLDKSKFVGYGCIPGLTCRPEMVQ